MQYTGDILIYLNQQKMDIVGSFKYVGEEFTSKRDYSVLCDNKATSAVGTAAELISLLQRSKIWERNSYLIRFFYIFLYFCQDLFTVLKLDHIYQKKIY